METEKYALLDTDFVSKMYLIRKDDQNKLIDLIMSMPNYSFFCHEQIKVELLRHNIAGSPEWFTKQVEDKIISLYNDEMIMDELENLVGTSSVAEYCNLLKNGCEAYREGYFEEKFVRVSQIKIPEIGREEFLTLLEEDCDEIGPGQNLGELKSYVLLQVLNRKYGQQLYVFCSDDKNARNGVVTIDGVRCISVLSSFVRLQKEIEFDRQTAQPYIDSYLVMCFAQGQVAFKIQDSSKERRMCKVPCEDVFALMFEGKIEELQNGNLRYK
ncbi:MAG: hypothetical protein Q4D16_21170 [Eubacteriales bacterium]|nr:hypothetical protein [Eubacteriales bacterium]